MSSSTQHTHTPHTVCSVVIDSVVYITAGEKEQKESLLFSALTKFMMKSALSSISEIERYFHHSQMLVL